TRRRPPEGGTPTSLGQSLSSRRRTARSIPDTRRSYMQRIRVIDSHTGGEPTRVVIEGGPDLGSGTLAERRERFRAHFDEFRSAVVNEPRGSDVLVGALLCSPTDSTCA